MRFMNSIIASLILGMFSFSVFPIDSTARPWRPAQVPNGEAIGCALCHLSAGGGGPRNDFGESVRAVVSVGQQAPFWGPELAMQDSDGDGFTNGEELQDPNGEWSEGDPQPGDPAAVTHPGDPDDFPTTQQPTADAWIAVMNGEKQVPEPIETEGRGTAVFVLFEEVMTMEYYINVFGLENVTNSHIHLGGADETGGVVYPLEIPTDGSSSGTLEITAEDIETMRAGQFYVNIHTEANPAGEIRGQIMDENPAYKAVLNGEQEVPPVETDASGSATMELSEDLMTLTYELTIMDIENVTASHIHQAPRGENGGVIFPLADSSFESVSGEISLDADQLATLLAEGYYVNVHTEQNPPGEIRGQIIHEDFEEPTAGDPTSNIGIWQLLK